MKALAIATLALLSGCATLRIEAEHVSHPTAKGNNEDALWQVSALLHIERGGWYAEGGFGVNAKGQHGGGFYGPALTGTARAGYEISLRRPK